MGQQAIKQDMGKAAAILKKNRCPRCGGTGNELFSMYRRCQACGGSGLLSDTTPERLAELKGDGRPFGEQ